MVVEHLDHRRGAPILAVLQAVLHVLKRSMEAQGTVSSHGLLVRLDLRALLRP